MTLAASSWWADWPKFLPGWLAFAWTLVLGARRVWLRRHHLALGPDDDELREALTTTRTLFEDITAHGGRRADWFQEEERRETARLLRDLADRRRDRNLREHLADVARTWDEAFALAPPMRIYDGLVDDWIPPHEREARRSAQQQLAQQTEVARTGLEHVKAAFTRLNELERRTLGRA
ncbi:hypothetical protein ACFV2N_25925 [Streptomyces sp. NPDC059680]|uniref:hypothetical protein n=1 Tax=Streptomyces sp. NPDC059680 TaxID=3346904 RepID=UPI0036A2286B